MADLAVIRGDGTGAALTLTARDIAERFIELYWRQALPHPLGGEVLRQNTGRQAAIIRLLSEARGRGSLAELRHDARAWQTLVTRVAQVVKVQPLWKLQTVGDQRLDFLYDNIAGGGEVTLRPGVACCLRAFHGLVIELVRASWLRYVRRYNVAALGDTTDLASFLFGSQRADLSGYAEVLRDLQSDTCFYCERPVKDSGVVDHFIPWSRCPVDLGHNFVLADGRCNAHKSDKLAAIGHLERWCGRNEDHAARLAQAFDHRGLVHDLSASQQIARWSYSEAEAAGALLWVASKNLVSIEPGWHAVL